MLPFALLCCVQLAQAQKDGEYGKYYKIFLDFMVYILNSKIKILIKTDFLLGVRSFLYKKIIF